MTTIVPVVPEQPAFDEVAALFDAYRVHCGQRSSPERTSSWLYDQLAQHRLAAAAAIRADRVCGFVTVAIVPVSLALGTAWSIRDLYVDPRHRRTGIANALLHDVMHSARVAGAVRVSRQTETGQHLGAPPLHRHRLQAHRRPRTTQPDPGSLPPRSTRHGVVTADTSARRPSQTTR